MVGDIRLRLGEDEVGNLVLAQIGMDERRFGAGAILRVEYRGQRFVFHLDQGQRPFSRLFVHGCHAGHRVAHVARAATAEDVPILQIKADVARRVLARDDGFYAGQCAGLTDVNALNQGMRMGTAQDARVQQPGAELQVVGEDGSPSDLLVGIYPGHALADEFRHLFFSAILPILAFFDLSHAYLRCRQAGAASASPRRAASFTASMRRR